MYQYTGYGGNSYIAMHLNIDSVVQKHTVSLTGNTAYVGNFGLWQGSLNSGAHKVTLDYHTTAKTDNTVSSDLEWTHWNKLINRAITLIIC